MKNEIIEALEAHLEGNIKKHRMNILIMLANPMAIHEHTDLLGAIETELGYIAEYHDKLEALNEVLS
jgi:hypothetical protein